LKPGQKLGKYEIKALIGRGGMAEVYRALNPTLKQDVAIKVLYPHIVETDNALARFEREAQSAAALTHPSILRVYDFDTSGDLSYMVMELVEGPTLRDRLRSYPKGMPQAEARAMFEKILEGVAFAHARGVIHRDIKPANVMIASGGRPLLTDFGLALMQDSERLTQTGQGAGTPAYMSPEQASGGTITAASDVYSLGIMLYEMITGRVPFEGDSYPQLLFKHIGEAPPDPRTLLPDLDPVLHYVILRALSKDPADRFAQAGTMLAALRGTAPADGPADHEKDETVIPGAIGIPDGGAPGGSRTPVAPPTMIPPDTRGPAGTASGLSRSGTRSFTANFTQTVGLTVQQSVKVIQRNPVLATGTLIAIVLFVIGLAIVGALSAGRGGVVGPAAPPGMVYVPGGTFTMGTAQGDPNEAPPHAVTLKPFFIDKTEVTNKDYLAFLLNTPRELPLTWPAVDRGNWVIEATTGYVIGSGSDKYSYDGADKVPITGQFKVDVDPDTDKGAITGTFKATIVIRGGRPAQDGTWSFVHDVFVGSKPFYQGGVGENVVMHGDTGHEGPIFPTMDGIVTTWGTGTFSKDGAVVASDVNFHVMYTDGVRDARQEILKAPGTCCYDPREPSKGFVDPKAKQLVILLSTADVYSDRGNATPPLFLELHLDDPKVIQQPKGGAAQFPPGTADQPVLGVTWEAAAAYCEARKARLPNEAEWEFAARGTDGRLFPWGDTAKVGDEIPANWTSGAAVKVGSYPKGASPYGALDMAGNAWEWVHDWYSADYYAASAGALNPVGPASGTQRVLRGGGFSQRDPAGGVEYRATYRLPFAPNATEPAFGFRCVQDTSAPG
jgi:serine/threonine-protein kinase